MKNFTDQFPVLGQYIYANTAACGLLSDGLMEWRQEHDLDYLIGGSVMQMKSLSLLVETKRTLGKFFNCKPENVALVPNFSLGLNQLLEGLDAKHKVLLLESDYPSVNWPFETRGFDISYAKIDENLEDTIFKKVKDNDISVLALSLVQWVNGVKIELEFLERLKSDFPDLIIIADGTQFCGTSQFDFGKSGIDLLGASGYKWLLAGYGNGFWMCKEDIKEYFSLKGSGFGAVNGNLNAKDKILFMKHLEPGHLDTLNFGSLKYSLDFLSRIGMDIVETRVEALTAYAKTKFAEHGLLESYVVRRNQHGPIFNIKGNDALFHHLTEKNVVCSQRGGGIRFSFHFYNTEKHINDIIKSLITRS
ncbi:aminotransferase class V-fold PLP-dependent enzyme [Flavobacteriaceae bacterium F89]|uniref:Aminotransferase class V-fold PLP-dependent enzyme n=1 Tax=Cerina litoralis TaxID=2874477 RepID=A0AAE3EVV0_9FLAO|nr:aminotransferase class V-fold PLP-dependent enzyme [Cerina litoralis]MCG2460586.1 aminotransferase class V-fold PLP-dependent enzyme [Cerina litoralis]